MIHVFASIAKVVSGWSWLQRLARDRQLYVKDRNEHMAKFQASARAAVRALDRATEVGLPLPEDWDWDAKLTQNVSEIRAQLHAAVEDAHVEDSYLRAALDDGDYATARQLWAAVEASPSTLEAVWSTNDGAEKARLMENGRTSVREATAAVEAKFAGGR